VDRIKEDVRKKKLERRGNSEKIENKISEGKKKK
jgi:hypothetical protein